MLPFIPAPSPAASDDGIRSDARELHFCRTCTFSRTCLAAGCSRRDLAALNALVQPVGPCRAGESAVRAGDPFEAITVVRSGMVKTRRVDHAGREQVLGFYLMGEVIGIDAIYPGRLPYDVVALEDTVFCRLCFAALSTLAGRIPALQRQLLRLASRELHMASVLAGDRGVDARMAAFLVDLGDRFASRGCSGVRFRLSMRRSDIANYLRLATETVSRSLHRLRARRLVHIEGREVILLQPERLQRLARG